MIIIKTIKYSLGQADSTRGTELTRAAPHARFFPYIFR